MIKIENVETCGWEAAIRGMRNPKNSWAKSDSGWSNSWECLSIRVNESKWGDSMFQYRSSNIDGPTDVFQDRPEYIIGPNDLDLMTRLRNAGTDHRKFMRMIAVYLDITAPLYWWKEFDTYKVGTVTDSCSTMHKIHAKEFELDDFSHEHIINSVSMGAQEIEVRISPMQALLTTIECLNSYRELYLESKDKKHWWQMIQLLPSSYNQRRTIMLNYEVLANIYKSRRNHKLDEWRELCAWIETLPYSELIIGKGENTND